MEYSVWASVSPDTQAANAMLSNSMAVTLFSGFLKNPTSVRTFQLLCLIIGKALI
jgi:hypothetical protein